jgi:superfamily II RNA helicase
MGLLETGSESTLTPLGVSATEVNEAHPILLSLFYKGGTATELLAEEVVTVLAVFLGEGEKQQTPVDALQVPDAVKDCLWAIDSEARRCQEVEVACGAPRPPKDGYWQLNASWVEPIWRWLQGTEVADLCTDYELYEGNLMRMLLKLVNVLEEWRSLATLATDTLMLQKLVGMELRLLRGIAICDSLYLRL